MTNSIKTSAILMEWFENVSKRLKMTTKNLKRSKLDKFNQRLQWILTIFNGFCHFQPFNQHFVIIFLIFYWSF